MAIEEITLNLSGVDLINLSGINELNIDLIRDNFSSSIVLRGEKLFIKGEQKETAQIETIFKELIFLQNRQGRVNENDVRLVIDLVTGSQSPDIDQKMGVKRDDLDEIIYASKSNYIKPRNAGQKELYDKSKMNDIVFAVGPAGTGKTYLAVAIALAALKNKQVNKIILSRPAVEAGESLGFLPGDLSEKVDPYLKPLLDSLEDMVPLDRLKANFEKNVIEVIPLAYMRGRTLNNAFMILDEAQNSTSMQMKMFLTRLGINSKAIITGDVTQIDLPTRQTSGLVQIQEILTGVDGISFVYFTKKDVVRHKLVKDIINAYEDYSAGGEKKKDDDKKSFEVKNELPKNSDVKDSDIDPVDKAIDAPQDELI